MLAHSTTECPGHDGLRISTQSILGMGPKKLLHEMVHTKVTLTDQEILPKIYPKLGGIPWDSIEGAIGSQKGSVNGSSIFRILKME